MRTITAGLESHLAGEVITLATCWKITRTDGVVMGFTDHDKDIIFESVTYKAASGFNATGVQYKADFSVDNLDIEGMLTSDDIKEADILAGKYDYAEVHIFIVNFENLAHEDLFVKRGWLGEVRVKRSQFVAELRGLSQKLSQTIGRQFLPACDAILGDTRCGVNLASFTFTSSITSVTDRSRFKATGLAQADNYFTGGEIQFTSGLNNGLKMEIKEYLSKEIALVLPMPNTISVGNTFSIKAGCDKTHETCKAKFSNLINFRGFPNIPGMDKILETAGTFERE